jgi:hypothetical protein
MGGYNLFPDPYDYSSREAFNESWHKERLRQKQAEGEEDVAREAPGRQARFDALMQALKGLMGQFPGMFSGLGGSSQGSAQGGTGGMQLPPRI